MRPTVITDPSEWAARLEAERGGRPQMDLARPGRGVVALVPTMGALHAGHLSLIRRARADNDVVAVSDYVNPLQFGPQEDLTSYPRDLDRDVELAGQAGADLIFAPSPEQMWPRPPGVGVTVGPLADTLDGAARPGHFDGVATIVAKLLILTGPCWAYFGEKDFQQLTVVRRLVADLGLPVEVVGCPTVRDSDGLALSSRNAYLTDDERAAAHTLYWALLAGRRMVERTDEDPDRPGPPPTPADVHRAMADVVGADPRFTLDYAEVVDPDDLRTPEVLAGDVRLLIAARLGRTRLIDNVAAHAPVPVVAGART